MQMYLHLDISGPLMKTCERVLIQEHAPLLREEFQVLLDSDRQNDLQRMYNLLSRIPDGLDPLRTKFEAHVRRAGLSAVDKIADDGGDNLEPKVYVDALLEVHTQYQSLVNTAFKGEAEFVRSLDNACREFVNRNKVCKSASTKSPELLAKYADSLLRKSAKSAEESDLENKLTAIMTVFKYVEDKDVFQKFYSKMLAKRLVNFTSASDDAETSMIGKLKEACGFEYTNKLQRMFQDMQISKDLNDSYKTWLEAKSDEGTGVDFSCQVLGTSFWPLNPPGTPFHIPEVIVQTYSRFVEFYNEKHTGRKLTWLWHLCKGDLKANYCKNAKVPYTFQVSTYQMAILLLFNDQTTVSYEEIEKNVGLTREYLDPSLGVFLKAKVLTISPAGSKPGPGTQLTLNADFKSKKIRVNLNMAVRAEQKQEVEETHKTIEEDRKLLMQVRLGPGVVDNLLLLTGGSAVCHCAHHEGSKGHEACRSGPGDDCPDKVPIYAQDSRHQKVYRYSVGEGIPGAVGWRASRFDGPICLCMESTDKLGRLPSLIEFMIFCFLYFFIWRPRTFPPLAFFSFLFFFFFSSVFQFFPRFFRFRFRLPPPPFFLSWSLSDCSLCWVFVPGRGSVYGIMPAKCEGMLHI